MTGKPKPTGRPHRFVPDPDGGEDLGGRRVCLSCNLLGRPGDAHHDTAALDADQAEARRRIGEDL